MSERATYLIKPAYSGGTNFSGEQQPGRVASERNIDGNQRMQEVLRGSVH